MKRLIFIFLTFISAIAVAQQKAADKPLVQFSGVILSADSGSIVPYVTITNVSNHNQAFNANYKGYFSFVVHEQDTLRFSSIGYAPNTVVIPSHLNGKSYTVQVKMRAQNIRLPVVHVFPWATTDEFHKDILTMKVADDDLEIARKNLSAKSITAMERTLPRDAGEIQSANSQAMHLNLVNQHSLPSNPLLNPFAWGSLIKEITAGDKSRASDN
jgi:hypothetical protein